MPLTRETLSAFSREMQKIAALSDTLNVVGQHIRTNAGNAAEMLGEQGSLALGLVNPNTTARTVRNIYRSSSNMHPEAIAERLHEAAEANRELQAAGRAGRYVSDITHGGGILNRARASGWLSNFAKYEGPNKLLQARNMLARALPGQRAILASTVLPTAYAASKKVDETGRVRGAGERILGTAGSLVGTLATQAPSVTRMLGKKGVIAGGLAQMAGSHLIGRGASRLGQLAGQKLDTLGRAPTPPAPQQQYQQVPQPVQTAPVA